MRMSNEMNRKSCFDSQSVQVIAAVLSGIGNATAGLRVSPQASQVWAGGVPDN